MKFSSLKAVSAAIATVTVASAAYAAPWQEGKSYKGGDQVENAGATYECKPFPYEGWCGLNAYEPGVGFAWTDAWTKVGDAVVTPTPTATPEPSVTPTDMVTPTPTGTPVDYPPFIPGQTRANNGEIYSFGNACWEAKNNPGPWESPREGWFWTEVPCGITVTLPVSPTVTVTPPPVTPSVTITPPPVSPTVTVTPPPVTPSVTVTLPPVTPTIPVSVTPGVCPTDDTYNASKQYVGGDIVIYQGHQFESSGWIRGNTPKIGVTSPDWQNPWKDLGPIAADWCVGVAYDTSGRILDMTGWPHPLKRMWKDYDTSSGKHVGAYFVEWGVYGRQFDLEDAPLASLTHMYYAFLTVRGDNSTSLNQGAANDGWAKRDFEINTYDELPLAQKGFHPSDRYPNGDGLAPGDFAGLLAEMTRAKVAHPQLKILPSVGGWTLSRPFFDMINDAGNRAIFVNSVERFLTDYATTFDGVDLDWEFPGAGGNDPDKGCYVENLAACQDPTRQLDYGNFTLLAKDLRTMLDRLEVKFGKPFELHAAVSPDPRRLQGLEWAELGKYFDGINFMTYDYAGAWSNVVGHQAPLAYPQGPTLEFLDGTTKKTQDWNAIGTVMTAINAGFPAEKASVGVAAYGRGWEGVPDDGNGARASVGTAVEGAKGWRGAEGMRVPYAGAGIKVGNVAPWEDGIMDYAYARQEFMSGPTTGANGYTYYYEPEFGAAWLYNPSNGRFISFDSVETVRDKGAWVKANGLGGLFMWEVDADTGELLNAMNESLGNRPE